MRTGNKRMMRSIPFIRSAAALLALLMLRTSICAAAPLTPGSIGILECTHPDHEIRTAWEKASGEISLDPLLLILNGNEVTAILAQWRLEGEAVEGVWRTADQSVLKRSRQLLDEAWKAYYGFAFENAHRFLKEAEELLVTPGNSRFRSGLAFEASVLGGMVLQAEGDGRFGDEFRKAAAVSPSAELSPERYSPEIISAYLKAKDELLKGERVFVGIDVSPDDAGILVDGKKADIVQGKTRLQVYPGRHFLEVQAPGYEPFSQVLVAGEYESPLLKVEMVRSGPDGQPDQFFLGRLKAGDRPYLSRLLGELEVDYVLIPEGREDGLDVWIVGKDGRAAAHGRIWSTGEDPGSATGSLSAILKPLRQEGKYGRQPTVSQMNLPPIPEIGQEPDEESGKAAGWKRLSVILGIVILAAAVSASGNAGGGGTTVEVQW